MQDDVDRGSKIDGQAQQVCPSGRARTAAGIGNLQHCKFTTDLGRGALRHVDKVRVRVRVMVHADVKSRVAICKLAEQGSRGFTQYVCVPVREIFARFLVDSNGMCVHLHARPDARVGLLAPVAGEVRRGAVSYTHLTLPTILLV